MINRTSRFIVTLAILSPIALTQANELDLRVSDDSLHGNYSVQSNESKLMFGLGYFYNDADNSINIVNVDLHAKDQTALGNLPTTVGIGFQGNVFKEGNFKGSAIGLGGSVRINLPDAPGLSIESAIHYAPDVLAFSDADAFKRFRAQVNYRIIESADISLGYHYLNAGIKNGSDRTFESGMFLGMKLKF